MAGVLASTPLTVKVYWPAVIIFAFSAQAVMPTIEIESKMAGNAALQPRRRAGIPQKSVQARTVPAPPKASQGAGSLLVTPGVSWFPCPRSGFARRLSRRL